MSETDLTLLLAVCENVFLYTQKGSFYDYYKGCPVVSLCYFLNRIPDMNSEKMMIVVLFGKNSIMVKDSRMEKYGNFGNQKVLNIGKIVKFGKLKNMKLTL